jgi:hypothetical protein
MRIRALISLPLVLLTVFTPAIAPAGVFGIVRWLDVIGIPQPGNVVGSGTGAVTGGGVPWSTTKGSARLNLDTGDAKFDVRGLVLAGGNSIGTRGGIAQVKGTFVCDTNGSSGGGNSALVDTPLVALDDQGNAKFSGNVGALPVACIEPDIAFLIRTAGGSWLAFGAVRRP